MPDLTDDQYRDIILKDHQSQATSSLAGVNSVTPQDAQVGIQGGPLVGVPASVAMRSPQQTQTLADQAKQQQAIQNPTVAQYLASAQPQHVAAVKDSLPQLAQVSSQIGDFVASPWRDWWNQVHAQASQTANRPAPKDLGGALSAIATGPIEDIKNLFGWANIVQQGGLLAFETGMMPPLLALHASANQAAAANPTGASILQTGLLGLSPGRGGTALAPLAVEAGPEVGADIGKVVSTPDGKPMEFGSPGEAGRFNKTNPADDGFFRQVVPTGRGTFNLVDRPAEGGNFVGTPPPGLSPETDAVHGGLADINASEVAGMEKTLADAPVTARTPEAVQDFLESTPIAEHNAYIDTTKLFQMATEGKITAEDITALAPTEESRQALSAALASGSEFKVPLSTYLPAAAGKPFADELRESTRFSEGGMSQTEVKEAPALVEPPIAPKIEEDPSLSKSQNEELSSLEPRINTAVVQASKSVYLQGLFGDAAAANMNEAQLARWSEKTQAAQQAIHAKTVDYVKKQLQVTRKPEWENTLSNHTAAVEKELGSRRDLVARHALAYNEGPLGEPLETPPLKLSRAHTISDYGQEWADSLPRNFFGKDGAHPDDLASVFGYDSGHEFLQDLRSGELDRVFNKDQSLRNQTKRLVKQEAQARARDELGFDVTPERLLEEAREQVSGPVVEDLLTSQLAELAKETGLAFARHDIVNGARALLAVMPVEDALNTLNLEKAVRTQGQLVERGLLSGKPADLLAAFDAAQKQLLNHYVFRATLKFQREFKAAMRVWQRLAQSPTSSTIDQEFLNHIHYALESMGFKVNRQSEELLESLQGLSTRDFVEKIASNLYVEPPYSDLPAPEKDSNLRSRVPTKMAVREFEDVNEMIDGLRSVGAAINLAYAGREAALLSEIGAETLSNATALGRRYPLDKLRKDNDTFFSTLAAKAGKVPRIINGYNIRPETLLYYLDRDKFGPMMRYVVNELAESRYAEDDLHKVVSKDLDQFNKDNPSVKNSMKQQVDFPELQWRGINWIRTRGQAVQLALNFGTEENLSKLLHGYNLVDPKGANYTWEMRLLDGLNRVLRPEDWRYVQKIWDIHGQTLWPKVVETYRDRTVSGVPPRKKTSRSVETSIGTLRGDYIPIRYDQAEVERLGLKNPALRSPSEMMGKEYESSAPSNNYAKSVTGFSAPLDLNFYPTAGMNQIIHDVSWRKSLGQAHRVLNHPDVVTSVQETLGPEYPKLNNEWLQYIAREAIFAGSGSDVLAGAVRSVRANYMATQIAFKFSTLAIHGSIAISHMLGEGGPKVISTGTKIYYQAIKDMFQSPGQTSYWIDFIDSKSGEVRNIALSWDRDIREATLRLEGHNDAFAAMKKAGFAVFAQIKKFEARATWLTRYNFEMSKSSDEARAIGLANKSVRDTQGAGSVMDLPPWLRGGHNLAGELGKTLTSMFMGFRNVTLNRNWRVAMAIRRVMEGKGDARDWTIFSSILTFFIVPSLLVYKLRKDIFNQKNFSLLEAFLQNSIGDYPIMDTGIDVALGGLSGERHTPIGEAAEAFAGVGQEALHPFMPEVHQPTQPIRSDFDAAGYAGLPVSDQMGIAAQYAWDVEQVKVTPSSALDYAHGLLAGAPPQTGRHHRRGSR